jgi:TonB-linked SusC/RagA family outer membrane protein
VRHLFGLAVSALLIGIWPAGASAQQPGTVTGRVIDASTQQPLVGVQVFVAGTNRAATTNSQGSYLILGAPSGTQVIRASMIGYAQVSREIVVQAGGTTSADFELAPSAIGLNELIVTATGQVQRRREVGSTVANISVADVDLAPVQSFSQLIQGRAPGVTVLQSAGTSGTGARVRIRGSNSISLSNEPMIIVDGIQVDNQAASFALGLGGQSISRLNDFSPEEIESIEILKGPAASALYGTAAANGVIQITTKRGRSGTARWNVFTEYGQMKDITTYPANWQGRGLDEDGEAGVCRTFQAAAGDCTPTEVRSWNPLMEVPPFRTGVNKTVGLNVTGGTDQVQYFLSGAVGGEDGIYQSNTVDRMNLRANMDAQVREDLNLSVRTGYTRTNFALPGNDNNTFGFIGAGLLGNAVDDTVRRGFYGFPNEYRFALDRLQFLHRFVASADANWRPATWLTLNATGGMDLSNRDDVSAVAPGIWAPTVDRNNAIGNRGVFAALIRNYTGRANAIGTFDLTPTITSITTIGTELRQDRFERVDASGFNMLPGTNSLGSLSERFSVNEFDESQRTVSTMASQQFGWYDRVFVTGSIRGDRNSNFGRQFGFQWYPSLSTSWVIGEEAWFPQSEFLSSMRLRTAWGRSGLMPGFRTAQQYYSATVATVRGSSVPAITIGGAGNADLRPEQSTEWEFGFDAGLLNDRVGLEFAYYDKNSTDALVSRRLAPSLGSSTTQTVNLGKVANSGIEAMLNARVLSLDNLDWDATVGFSTNKNKLVRLGEGIEPIVYGIGGDSQRHAEGLPLGHYYGLKLVSWGDADGDGLISEDEVELSSEPTMLGRQFPSREFTFSSTFTLFDRVRVYALLDHKGGHQLFNSTEEFRCNTFFNCRGVNDHDAPLWEQARGVAAIMGSIDPYVEDADFTKLREVSLTVFGIEKWLSQAGVRGLADISLTVSGRNLATWTKYSGFDPEMNSGGQLNHSTYDFLGQPPVRSWTVRLNVGF